jgi:hypothetical protein
MKDIKVEAHEHQRILEDVKDGSDDEDSDKECGLGVSDDIQYLSI